MDNCGFVLDSGASDHLINDESLYTDSVEVVPPLKIAVAKQGKFIYATKRGIVRLRNDHEITLEDVLFCKEAAGNLMSVKRLQEAGMSIEFDKSGVTISKNGLMVVKNSENQLADIFTKPLPAARFVELRDKLGLLQDDQSNAE
uniref:RH25742p n=1 Tax=Drosophila melanogaster TaxID=7227 RepID=Q8SXF7_DROME|nr:RH25742p [Drosophila melanogaster]